MNSTPRADSTVKEVFVAQLADEFLDRYRRGQAPSIAEYTRRHPEVADEIREYFPVATFLEGLASSDSHEPSPYPAGLPPGDQLGEFRMIRLIGQGSMGVVYLAEQISEKRVVALKVLSSSKLHCPKYRQRFSREARAAARLTHPHIVPVYAVGEDRGEMYYAMQYIEGQQLDRGLGCLRTPADARDGQETDPSSSGIDPAPADWQFITRIGQQLAEALHYAHGQGVLHRDIKPANVMLDERGHPWITDFGLAKVDDDRQTLTRDGELVGTIRYMAPEAIEGRHTPQSDIYSLGVSLYELLAGQPAFAERKCMPLLRSIVAGSVSPLDPRRQAIPPDLATVIHTAIHRLPKERYQTAEQLAADLTRVLQNQPVTIRRRSLREQFGDRFQKS